MTPLDVTMTIDEQVQAARQAAQARRSTRRLAIITSMEPWEMVRWLDDQGLDDDEYVFWATFYEGLYTRAIA